jgi:hypothetical protein
MRRSAFSQRRVALGLASLSKRAATCPLAVDVALILANVGIGLGHGALDLGGALGLRELALRFDQGFDRLEDLLCRSASFTICPGLENARVRGLIWGTKGHGRQHVGTCRREPWV